MFVDQCGAPWRRRRAPSCLRGWRIRCCRFHACAKTQPGRSPPLHAIAVRRTLPASA